MKQSQAFRAAEILADARTKRYQIVGLPTDLRPSTLQDSLLIQDKLFSILGGSGRGWFLGGTNGSKVLPFPYSARILPEAMYESGAVFRSSDFLTFDVDVEFGFTFSRKIRPGDWKNGDDLYSVISSIHPTLDVVNSQLHDLDSVGWQTVIANNGADGAIIRGPAMPFDATIDLEVISVRLLVNERQILVGDPTIIMGNPLNSVRWFLEDMTTRRKTIKQGDFLATGSCTPVYVAVPGDRIVADFGQLGRVETLYLAS